MQLLARLGWITEQEILQLAADKNYIRSLGIDATSLEGYLFPDTYYFERTQDGSQMFEMMVKEFWRHYPETWRVRAREEGLTVHEVITLASMVEKEARVDAERPLVAAVFRNRLNGHMPLQSDPTAVYMTWLISLVPLPQLTCNGRVRIIPISAQDYPRVRFAARESKSIQAVLYPENVPYLYFVSNNDGTHHFSTTLAEHNAAVRECPQETEKSNTSS